VLEERLAACEGAGTWTLKQGEQWWEANLAGIDLVPSASMAEKTLIIAPRN
jgi:hypothetical protein